MPLVNFSNLDFDQIKTSIKDYLRANSNFTDYDYEGSNLSTIIDTLAYNTYITSYNANMVTNEVFIDGATLRENVVSLARNIGYVPKSRNAAKASISFAVDTSSTTAVSVTLKRGIVTVSSNRFANVNYVFSIPDDITIPVNSDGLAIFNNIDTHEGTHLTQTFNVSSRTPNQKYILTNSGIDTDLITVLVREGAGSTITRTYKQFSSLYEVDSTSPVYFIQEIENERYELLFGDGVFGLKLQEPNIVEIGYITSSGEDGNGISQFTFAGQLVDNNNTPITNGISLITTEQQSFGGSDIESVESVKKNAPQIYASQNRAVTAADYEVLIPRIYPEAESVSAFGGEELTPPQYGKVFISVKPENGVHLSTTIKEDITRELRKYSVAGIVSEIVDLKYLYVESDSYVYYNENKAPSSSVVSSLVTSNIGSYANSTELNKFGARFKYSKYQKIIDDTHVSITSNITTINIRRDMEPLLNAYAEYELCFGNRFYIKNHGHSPVSNGTVVGYNIKTSAFKVSGISGDVYLGDKPNPGLKTGSIFLFKLNSPTEPVVVKQNIGIIDYVKGEIKLNPIKIISTSVNRGTPLIEVSAVPYSNDVIGLQDLYLQLDTNNVVVNTVSDQIASGDDVSGSNYIVTSSYSNGSIVRGTPLLTSTQTVTQPAASTSDRVTNVTITTGNAGSSQSTTYSY
tara:strand:- start:11297 stop:13354 length:2058 start_codon:yes stop_codon:yes gene_type:complete